jgi:excisionase family DNA binding protein
MLSGVVPILGGVVESEYMNAQTLATHLGVTERTVRRWIERGELHAERQGRSYLIRREDGERTRFARLGQVVDERVALEQALAERERELAVLQGRYAELQERNQQLEDVLHEERRRIARLEVELEHAPVAGQRRAA